MVAGWCDGGILRRVLQFRDSRLAKISSAGNREWRWVRYIQRALVAAVVARIVVIVEVGCPSVWWGIFFGGFAGVCVLCLADVKSDCGL